MGNKGASAVVALVVVVGWCALPQAAAQQNATHARVCEQSGVGDGLTFFTFWTTPAATFRARYLRSIESVLKHHPGASVVVYSNTLPASFFSNFTMGGCDVHVAALDVDRLVKDTPLESWASQRDRWQQFPYYYAHLTDALRLAVLWHHGGVYFDTDIVFVAPITQLHNAVGVEDLVGQDAAWEDRLCNAFLAFEPENEFIGTCIAEFANTYVPDDWAQNGPALLTRVWNRQFRSPPSPHLSVLPRDVFFMVSWRTIDRFFKRSRPEFVDREVRVMRQRGVVAVHFWNKMSQKVEIEEGSLMRRLMDDACVLCDQDAV